MRILITGATGFVGQHLVRLLASRKDDIFGTHLSPPGQSALDAELLSCDVRDAHSVRSIVHHSRPHRIYHLAGLSSPAQSLEQTREVYETNFWGTYNLLEAARQLVPKARILIVSSGQCYGSVGNGKALTESVAFDPPNPYALSKAAADMLAGQYHLRFGLNVMRARPFNHTGPGQQPGFVCSDYARHVAAIEVGKERALLRVRDTSAKRDFTDVRDVVRAYELLMEKGKAGEAYNVASGRSISVKEIISILVSCCSRPVRILDKRQRLKRDNIPNFYGSSVKLVRATGWKPRYNMTQTLRDLFDYWKLLSNKGDLKHSDRKCTAALSELDSRSHTCQLEGGNVNGSERVS